MKLMHLFGGGTIFHVRPHLALCAPAFGRTAHELDAIVTGLRAQAMDNRVDGIGVRKHITAMAGGEPGLMTNRDVAKRIEEVVADPETKFIFMSAALCDFEGSIMADHGPAPTKSGKDQPRLRTDQGVQFMQLTPAEKVIKSIRQERKSIFLVGFKTTAGATEDEQFDAGLSLLKGASCNLVLANDVHTRKNMIITPEQARYHVTTDRFQAMRELMDMTLLRSQLRFTRSQVVPGKAVPWKDDRVPQSLRRVVDHCVDRGAYKPFEGKTVGHFAVKVDDSEILTSIRKSNFNKLRDTGLVRVEARGDDDEVIAHGFKPSVGGQSQRIIFSEHPDLDCIVHFHCPLKPGSDVNDIPVREQRPYECGSHECGRNTSDGLKSFGGIHAVMLDKHGPNIVFNRSTDPERVIDFIERNWDLTRATSEA